MKFQGKTHHEVIIKIEIKYINTWCGVAAVDEMRMRILDCYYYDLCYKTPMTIRMTMTMTMTMTMMMMMMMISWLSQVSSHIRKLPCTKAVRVLSTFIIETRPNCALGLYPENQLLISKKMHSWNKHIYTNHQFLGSV